MKLSVKMVVVNYVDNGEANGPYFYGEFDT